MTTAKVIARRRDGHGFLIGRLVGIAKRHGKNVFTIRTVNGEYVTITAAQYSVSSR